MPRARSPAPHALPPVRSRAHPPTRPPAHAPTRADTSSVKVHVQERRRSFFHFLTMVSAIVGGVFTVMGVVDGAVEKLVARFARRGGVLSI